MIIMSKFQKRLKKLSDKTENCLVVGKGFGHLSDFIEIYKTVFVVDNQRPDIKAKNIVYRDNFDETSHMTDISCSTASKIGTLLRAPFSRYNLNRIMFTK